MPKKPSTIEKHKNVIREWFANGKNGVKAYMKFYPDSEYASAGSNFYHIIKNAEYKPFIEEQEEILKEKTTVRAEDIINELQLIIGADTADFYDEEGNLKPFHELGDLSRTISQVTQNDKIIKSQGEESVVSRRTDLKGMDKLRALDMLAKLTGYYKAEKVDVTHHIPPITIEGTQGKG